MINFEPKYVHCFWDDELEGKKGIVSDTIGGIKDIVENITDDRYEKWFGEICKNPNNSCISYPFGFINDSGCGERFQFCYYDPNFEYKVAYEEGKEIQYYDGSDSLWHSANTPTWNTSLKYRIKPTEEECCVIYYKSTNCFEVVDDTETVFSVDDIFFTGRKQECRKWIKEHNDLQNIIEAYYSGKKIQYFEHGLWIDWTLSKTPMITSWVGGNWRIKPNDEYEVVILYEVGLRIIPLSSSGEFRRIFFKGTEKECKQWVKDNYHLQIVIDGYFENEPIVYKEKGVKNDPWKETKELPYNWDFDHYEYRINRAEESKEDKYVPFENTQELIEAWEKKCPANKDRPNGTMPLIWIKEKKHEDTISLITDFTGYGVSTSYKDMSFDSLFEKYTFADGSVCGKMK